MPRNKHLDVELWTTWTFAGRMGPGWVQFHEEFRHYVYPFS